MTDQVENKVSKIIENIFIWWGGNSYYPEFAIDYKNSLDELSLKRLVEEMNEIIQKRQADCALMNHLTSGMGFHEDQQAADFFEDVYAFLFSGGAEPDIDNYIK